MFNWEVLVFLWLLVAALFAGFGWAVGSWIAERVFKK